MKAPKQTGLTGSWERTLARYLTVNKVPVRWQGQIKGFTGLAKYTLRRIAPMQRGQYASGNWSKMPEFFREHRDEQDLIVFVTNRKYGDSIEDSFVIMRLGTFGPIFASHINNDRERYVDAAAR